VIAIIDYGAGNLESVVRAFHKLGTEAEITADPATVAAATRIVLPGVGFFDKAMGILRTTGIADTLQRRVIQEATPVLGICLGFQMFCAHSEEGNAPGLGWLDARVLRLPAEGQKIPHIGWNDPAWQPEHPWARGIGEGACFYFAHSYYVNGADPAHTAATCHYGANFSAAFQRENIFGTQFHPEKSHGNGLHLLKNFLELTTNA
jgi:glutamine amidotransferase